jgi:transcriptional regulator with XRE-family HTH domain
MVVIVPLLELHNRSMPTAHEKAAFSQRLQLALNRLPKPVKGPTQLANQFNLRHRGDTPVSPQTTHKWLSGRTVPTADKIKTLAEWLHVNEHWLHYGPAPTSSGATASADTTGKKTGLNNDGRYPFTPDTLTLASKIQRLSPHQRYLVEELVTQFYAEAPPE